MHLTQVNSTHTFLLLPNPSALHYFIQPPLVLRLVVSVVSPCLGSGRVPNPHTAEVHYKVWRMSTSSPVSLLFLLLALKAESQTYGVQGNYRGNEIYFFQALLHLTILPASVIRLCLTGWISSIHSAISALRRVHNHYYFEFYLTHGFNRYASLLGRIPNARVVLKCCS